VSVGLVDEILSRPELVEAPPVLVDIGAGGPLHSKWQPIARYCICVAFEGGEAEVPDARSRFRELHLRRAIVAERASEREPFYLTRFPFCSSRLRPTQEGIRRYAFAPLFEIEDVLQVETLALPDVLEDVGFERVDWFKTDSQGTDLRLFASLGDEAIARVLVAEFEPGIIDAYEDEDKLSDVIEFMASRSFWMSDLSVRGTPRVTAEVFKTALDPLERRLAGASLKRAPGWAEVEYLNDFEDDSVLDKREFMLGCLFALLRGHAAFTLELALRGQTRFGDAVFHQLEAAARRAIRRRYARLPLAAIHSLGRS
jgi:Methyltransferase FkbM domain